MDETIEIKVTSEMAGKRLDVVLSEQCSDLTRSYINKLCKEERAALNGKTSKGNKKCKEGDVITLQVPEPTELEILPEEMNLDIVYEDNDLLVVNKPSGMVVHPAPGHSHNTLVNALLFHCKMLSDIGGQARSGIVHRIDKDTSGLLVVSKNNFTHKVLSEQLRNKTTKRKYIAIVIGNINHNLGKITAPIGRDPNNRQKMAVVEGGKEAVTHFKVLDRYRDATLIELELETGRTHQIRVHMAYIGHPVLNDPLYGIKKQTSDFGQYLHAKTLGFIHPRTNQLMEFNSDIPQEFYDKIEELKSIDQKSKG